jgi:hypothetical protein
VGFLERRRIKKQRAAEKARIERQKREEAVGGLIRRLGVSRGLAEYLVGSAA